MTSEVHQSELESTHKKPKKSQQRLKETVSRSISSVFVPRRVEIERTRRRFIGVASRMQAERSMKVPLNGTRTVFVR